MGTTSNSYGAHIWTTRTSRELAKYDFIATRLCRRVEGHLCIFCSLSCLSIYVRRRVRTSRSYVPVLQDCRHLEHHCTTSECSSSVDLQLLFIALFLFGVENRGTKFFRIIPNFVIQGGDVTHDDGSGGMYMDSKARWTKQSLFFWWIVWNSTHLCWTPFNG